MKIYVVGSSKNKFLQLNNIRQKFLIDQPHEGDNIDRLNSRYCELTGLYYLWKHCDDDIVGLEHYRRYFVNSKNQLLSEAEIKAKLELCDILCIRANYSARHPVITWINASPIRKDFDKFICFAKHYVGRQYADACVKILNGSYHCLGNMFICKKQLIDEYCEFIFDLLDAYQQCEIQHNRTPPKRVMGYFAEFLFAAWLELHHKKIGFCKLRMVK